MTDHKDFIAGQHTRLNGPSPSMPVRWADGAPDLASYPITFYDDPVRSLELRPGDVVRIADAGSDRAHRLTKFQVAVELKILDRGAAVPAYATEGSAAVDLVYAGREPLDIWPGDTQLVGTGIAIGIKHRSIVAKIYPRSSLGLKGLVLANGTGIIDSDYRGEIKVALWNRNREGVASTPGPIHIEYGDRIAQMTFERVYHVDFQLVDELSETARGAGGFGSTGR